MSENSRNVILVFLALLSPLFENLHVGSHFLIGEAAEIYTDMCLRMRKKPFVHSDHSHLSSRLQREVVRSGGNAGKRNGLTIMRQRQVKTGAVARSQQIRILFLIMENRAYRVNNIIRGSDVVGFGHFGTARITPFQRPSYTVTDAL